jgi:DNA-directed RNA polymerase subunit RPC12/RpoP
MLPRPGVPTRLSTPLTTRTTRRRSPIKPPERCPHCNSKRLIKKGTRKKKLEDVPLYRCRECGRTFAPGPRTIRNKTYPLPEILEAFTLYDRGNTLEATAEKISSRYGHRVAPSTISRWLAEHPALTTYHRLRDRGRRLFTPTQLIRTQKLYHRQVYEFAYHRAKLAFLKDGTLDDTRASCATSTARFSALADFLESIPQTCPHDLFSREDGARSSQLASDFLALDKLIVVKKQNAADMAALILPAVGSNYERQPKLQRFMLANDSTTIAVEVPVWLTQQDITALEREQGIRLVSAEAESSITGHIDFLQVRNGAVHILDYKPDARTNAWAKPDVHLVCGECEERMEAD